MSRINVNAVEDDDRSCSETKISLAITTRLLFAAHNIISIWRVVHVTQNPRLWLLGLSLVGLAGETLFTVVKNRGNEWKWFCPSALFFLIGSVPAIWILEFDLLNKRETGVDQSDFQKSISWVLALEQLLLFVLIVGRWLLPKGAITRNQLSQLLLVYIATAADIIEFFDSFNADDSQYNTDLITAVLTLWSWSLLQFTLVLTSTRGSLEYTPPPPPPPKEEDCPGVTKWGRFARMRDVVVETSLSWPWGRFRQVAPLPNPPSRSRVVPIRPEDEEMVYAYKHCACLESEMWAVMTGLCLQDGPFLVLRLILITHYNNINHLTVFFTTKNAFVLILQIYRLIVVHQERIAEENERKFARLRALEMAAQRAANTRNSNGRNESHAEEANTGDIATSDPYEIAQYQEVFKALTRR